MIKLEQFVDRVIDYTVRCLPGGKYAPVNLCGKCTKYPAYGDCGSTYTMRSYEYWQKHKQEYVPHDVDPFGAEHYIVVGFKNAVIPQDIFIYETMNPGSVVRIWGRYNDFDWKLLWEGPPQVCPGESRRFHPTIRKSHCLIKLVISVCRSEFIIDVSFSIVRLEFNNEHLRKHRTAIDAVLLKGNKISEHLVQVKNFFRSMARSSAMSSKRVNVDESSDLYSRLPGEIVLLIFQYLDLRSLSRCAQVSKTWNKIVRDSILYRSLSLKRYWYNVNGETLNTFKNRCKQLKKLDLSWCGSQDKKFTEAFHGFLDSCGQLTHLSLCRCTFIRESILKKISNCGEITELRLTGIFLPDPSQFKRLSKLNKLISLDISYTEISYTSLIEILKANPSLRHVSVDFCRFLKRLDCVASTVSAFNKKLLTWSSFGLSADDDFREPYFATCVHLEALDLGWCLNRFRYEEDFLERIAVNCTNLQRLGVSYWFDLTDNVLLPVVKYCKNLTHLDLSGNDNITSDVCEKALIFLSNLILLDISFCHSITNERVTKWRQDYSHITIHHVF